MKRSLFLAVATLLLVCVVQVAHADDDELNPSKLALLPKECGVSKLGKTGNDTKSLVFEFPWIALVRFNKTRRPATCLGSLINQRYVLSVIGCIRKTKKDPDYVRLGEQSETTDPDCNVSTDKTTGEEVKDCAGPFVDILIESYVFHPEFDNPMYTNDLALLRLDREVQYNDYIRPICLPTTPELRSSVPKFLVMPAWELDMNARNHYVGVLEKYYVENIDLDACQRLYENAGFTPEFDDEKRFCALQLGPNYVCSRVPGSPISTEVDIGGVQRHVEFAMAKFAPLNCTAREKVPMISMRITKYMKWITDNLEE